MKKIITGVAIATMWATVPALAADKMDQGNEPQNQSLNNEGMDTRHKSEDGTLQGKPVVEGPAEWTDLHASGSRDADSSASGASSGEAGQGSESDL